MTTFTEMTPAPTARQGALKLTLWFGGYSVIALTLTALGVFAAINTNIFPGVVAVATIGLTIAAFRVPAIRALAEELGPYGLAYFHVWRIPAGLAFLWGGAQGLLPMTFVNNAGWGDLMAGVLAAVLLLLPRRRLSVTGFHLFGFGDFLLAVGTGIYLNAVAPESMAHIVLLPFAIIPLVGVPLSGATHIVALSQLMRGRRA